MNGIEMDYVCPVCHTETRVRAQKVTPMADKYDIVRKDKVKSIWDDDIDYDKVMKLSPRQRYELFPDDFMPDGSPRGDF